MVLMAMDIVAVVTACMLAAIDSSMISMLVMNVGIRIPVTMRIISGAVPGVTCLGGFCRPVVGGNRDGAKQE